MKVIIQMDEHECFDQWRAVLIRHDKLDEHGKTKAEAVEKLAKSIEDETERLECARRRLQNM